MISYTSETTSVYWLHRGLYQWYQNLPLAQCSAAMAKEIIEKRSMLLFANWWLMDQSQLSLVDNHYDSFTKSSQLVDMQTLLK